MVLIDVYSLPSKPTGAFMTTAKQLIAYLRTIPENTKILVLHKDRDNEQETYFKDLSLAESKMFNTGEVGSELYLFGERY